MSKMAVSNSLWLAIVFLIIGILCFPLASNYASALANSSYSNNLEAQANKSGAAGVLGESGLTQQQMQSLNAQTNSNPKLTPPPVNFEPECPANLKCVFKPAAYKANSSALNDFGNYNLAQRPDDLTINQIVIHTTEGSLDSAINHFQDPTSYVSANYIVAKDGSIVQMVRLQDIAFQAGDWYVNSHSIGIEHEGASEVTPLTAAQYAASTTLTKWLAAKYNIKLDRAHIVGHDNVPTPSDPYMGLQHWDPGPYFDWTHYMQLVGGSNGPVASASKQSSYITITPKFSMNKQVLNLCYDGKCSLQPAKSSSFLPLYQGPDLSSGLLKDPYLGGLAGTNAQQDWGDKAPTGYSYVVAERKTGWTAIWFAGQKAWFQDDGTVTTNSAGVTITPKNNRAVAVYGRPMPEPSATGWKDIPAPLRINQVALTKYTLQPGQAYTVDETAINDYAEGCQNVACTYPGDTTVVIGNEKYLQITYNHRFMYIKASDVTFNYAG